MTLTPESGRRSFPAPSMKPVDDPHGEVPCRHLWLGRIDYLEAWELQRRIARERAAGEVPDTLLLLEHPPTYTLGRRGGDVHLRVSREFIAERGACLHHSDRGGDVTFHGPGQLVGYPIVDLTGRRGGVSRHMLDLMEVLIRTLGTFGIRAERMRKHTGVWVGDEKIAALGVKVDSRGITQHGFGLNVSTDLSYFSWIVPCGIPDKGVTSMERLLAHPVAMKEVVAAVVAAFGVVFEREMENLVSL